MAQCELALMPSRKAFATRLISSGADLKTVMSLTGHTQVAVLMRYYAQAVPEKQEEALERALEGMRRRG
jgi:site-specific recombinase XerD